MPPKAAPGTQKITSFFSVKKPTTSSSSATEKSPKKTPTSNDKSENVNKRKRNSVTLDLSSSSDDDGYASPILTRSQRAAQTKSPSSTPNKSTTSTTPTKPSSASKTTTTSTSSKSTPTKSTPTKSTVTFKKKTTPVKMDDWSDDDFGIDKVALKSKDVKKEVPQKNKVIIDDDDALSSQDVVSSPSTKKRKTSSPFTKSPRKVKEEEEIEEKPKTTPKSPKKEVKKEEKKKETKKKDDDDDDTETKPAETKKRNFYDKTQHQNQQKAKNHGCKTVPVGKANCLKDKAFVITGQMESMDREEMEDLIKQYGGVIRVSVSGRTNFVVVGDGPGESKMKKVREHKTKQLSEDDLLEMIAKSNPSGKDSMDETDDDISPPPQKFIPPPRPSSSSSTQVIKSKNADDQLWVEKYKPSLSSQIIGHNKECGLLLTWLKEWHANLDKEIQAAATQTKGRKKAATEWKRAAFLSGPPGVGKSTSAALIAKEAGFTNIVELNASDTRSKKAMKEQIIESCLSNNINNYFQKKDQQKPKDDKKQTIVIMDEVDGMSSGDRGGVAELVQIIKQTRVPVICIANDRSKISLKTLITHCLDLKFSRPSKTTITKKLLEVCKKENLSIDNNALEYMVESLNNDIRSVLNNLQLINRYSAKDHIGYLDAKNTDLTKTSSTDGIFDVVKDVLGQNTKKYNERLEDFYFDPMLVPLFVEQNYVNIRPSGNEKERIQRISYASDSISMGDVVNSKIRKEMSFGLMNSHAFYSTMYPAYFIRGSFQALRGYDKYYQFPAVLGKGSTTTKNYNALKTIQKTTSLKASADTLEMLDYLPLLSKTLLNPLLGGDKDVQETIEAMDEYQISRDDLEFMCELSTFKGKNLSDQNKDWFSEIDTKTKTALTRQYNKAHKGFNKVSAAAALSKVEDDENPEAEEEDEEDDLKADKFVTKMKNIAKLEAFEKKREKSEKKSTKKTTKKESTKKEVKKEVKKETEKKPLVLKKK